MNTIKKLTKEYAEKGDTKPVEYFYISPVIIGIVAAFVIAFSVATALNRHPGAYAVLTGSHNVKGQ